MAKQKRKKVAPNTVALNKKARHDYFIEEHYEAGIVLEGWEVKALRAAKVQLKESYIRLIHGEVYLMGCHISALDTASTHVVADPLRVRKLLLHRAQIAKLSALVERKGYTLIPLSLYWKKGNIKLDVGVAKGKKQHDKRVAIKDREWKIDQARGLKLR